MNEPIPGVRLNKFVADSGYCSRREADQLIADGRILIDERVGVLGDKVMPGMRVSVDGRQVFQREEKIYIALHKPVGIVCTADSRERMNVVDYLNFRERVYPIGRLDKNSSGLLLMTNDGDIVNAMLRAAGNHEKEYIVTVDKPITQDFMVRMAKGVPILDTVTLPARIFRLGDTRFRLIIVQGLNRQIRRMCEALRYNVTSLQRVRVMNIELGDLKPGEWRMLTDAERDELFTRLNITKPE